MTIRRARYHTLLGILLHDPAARLLRICTRHGDQYYVEPGGLRVELDIVKELARDLVPVEPGLFEETPLTWKHRCHGGGGRG